MLHKLKKEKRNFEKKAKHVTDNRSLFSSFLSPSFAQYKTEQGKGKNILIKQEWMPFCLSSSFLFHFHYGLAYFARLIFQCVITVVRLFCCCFLLCR